ncbi:hypothetical protein OVS_04150 [Mycoplasma ovis str. Michigan]|uniref:Uncharacterized protein n=2 Tax=Mycoplasma ovis TaxID=171632 RepID=A0ABN4BNV5_9MOLU|nr:hypothetical protein OVS_04150 [Mycoplasma ovis str. Michigan]
MAESVSFATAQFLASWTLGTELNSLAFSSLGFSGEELVSGEERLSGPCLMGTLSNPSGTEITDCVVSDWVGLVEEVRLIKGITQAPPPRDNKELPFISKCI